MKKQGTAWAGFDAKLTEAGEDGWRLVSTELWPQEDYNHGAIVFLERVKEED